MAQVSFLWLCSEDIPSYSLREMLGSEILSGTSGVLFAPLIWLSKQLEPGQTILACTSCHHPGVRTSWS